MKNRDDGDPEKKKGNTDKRHEPEDAQHENRLARGDIEMPGPGGSKFSSQTHQAYLKDHQREQEKAQQQRDSREATGRSDAERETERSNLQVAEKSPFLGNEFRDAKARDDGKER